MPRPGSLTAEIVDVLKRRTGGATMKEIRAAVATRRPDAQPHSIRSALVRHVANKGEKLFRRETTPGRQRGARYFLKQ